MTSIDVAIPNYQYGRFLRDCVESVLGQGAPQLRVLIIDNASTDNSAEVAQQLASEDERVRFVRHRSNLGHQASFNEAIDWAEAESFLLLCADDMLAPGALMRCLPVLEQNPEVHLAFGRSAALRPAGSPRPEDPAPGRWSLFPARKLLERFCRTGACCICSCAAVVRTASMKRVGHYRPTLQHTDDFEFWMRVAALEGSIAETRSTLALLRVHGNARSAAIRADRSRDILNCQAAFASFFANEGADLPDSARLRRWAARALVGRSYWSGLSHACRGEHANAIRLLRYAVRRSWETALLPPFDHLLRMEQPVGRIAAVLDEAWGGPRPESEPEDRIRQMGKL
ncbi:glycosyltransferase family 2 protein [Kaistia sp. MMO-174]|uniref:glycosyltransferase family 2 protein n=1 Tax=Kaistia sp. MMO-174 TaxID=3081256 RepID=UPI003015C22C